MVRFEWRSGLRDARSHAQPPDRADLRGDPAAHGDRFGAIRAGLNHRANRRAVGTEAEAVMTLRAGRRHRPYQTPARRMGRATRREASPPRMTGRTSAN